MVDYVEIGLTAPGGVGLSLLQEKLNEGWQIIGHAVYAYDGEVAERYTLYKPEQPTREKVNWQLKELSDEKN